MRGLTTMRSVGKLFAKMSRLGRKLAGDETGSPAVEFALVFPIFIAVVLATLQAGDDISWSRRSSNRGRSRRPGSFSPIRPAR